MKKFFEFLTSEEIIIISFSLILLVCSYVPLIIQYLTPPTGKFFLGSFGFPPDFYGNLASFQEGRLGHWQYINKVSSTIPQIKTWLKPEYLLLGQISRLFPIEPVIFFHLSRFFLSLILILTSYRLMAKVFSKKYQRLTAFTLAFFSTAIGNNSKLISFWTPLSVFQRIAYFQHYLVSFILVLGTIIFLNQALLINRLKFWIVATFLGFLTAWIHAFNLISLLLTLPFYFFLDKNKTPRKYLKLLAFSFISFLPLIYIHQLSRVPPWNTFSKIELQFNLAQVIGPVDFLLGIGLTSFLGLAGALLAIKKGGSLNLLLAPWAVIYLLGFWWLWRLFGVNAGRFIQTPFYIILGILSVYVLDFLAKHKAKTAYFLTLLVILPSLPAYRQSLAINRLSFLSPASYASSDYLETLAWLGSNSKEEEVVLSGETNGMIIAGRVGNLPYLATFSGNLDYYEELKTNAQKFYSGAWEENQAIEFVRAEKIKYVFFGPEEKNLAGKSSLTYPFLEKVFENPEATIFKVIPR